MAQPHKLDKNMQLRLLVRKSIDDLLADAKLLRTFALALSDNPWGQTPEDVVEEMGNKLKALYSWDGGLLVTEIHQTPARRELYVSDLYGKNFVKNWPAILSDLKDLACWHDCTHLAMATKHKGLIALCQDAGAEETYVYMALKVK